MACAKEACNKCGYCNRQLDPQAYRDELMGKPVKTEYAFEPKIDVQWNVGQVIYQSGE